MAGKHNGGFEPVRDLIKSAVIRGERGDAMAAATEALADGVLTPRRLYMEILAPILIETGANWQSGRLAVWREHQISQIIRSVIESVYPYVNRLAQGAPANDKTAVLACPAQEQHDLWLRMLADLFETAGWHVVFVGADTPTTEIAAAVRDLDAAALVLSISTHFNRVGLRMVARELEEACPDVKIWVTGAAFAGMAASDWTGPDVLDPDRLDELLGDEAGA